jgi:site-specific recombinase XerD
MAVKLLDRVREATRTRHYSRRTEDVYVHWIRRYIVFHGKAHPSGMGAREIAAFLGWLAVQRKVSASTQNQALSAILFLYRDVLCVDPGPVENVPRAAVPVHIPVVLSVAEVKRVLDQMDGVCRLIASLLYGAGTAATRMPRDPREGH